MKNHPLATKEVVAMVCITILACIALFKGLDAYLYTVAILGIAGIAGYQIKAHLPEGIDKFLKNLSKKGNGNST